MNALHVMHRRPALMLALVLSIGCGSGAPGNGGSDIPADDGAGVTADEPEAAASDALSLDYLVGEWCAGEAGRPARTIWIFDGDATVRMGRPGALMQGPDVETFVNSATLVSRGEDEFVVSQAGTEVQFTRGSCPTRAPAEGGP